MQISIRGKDETDTPLILFVFMLISVQKASCAAALQAARDSPAVYEFEGQGSSAGSVGCCSLLESDNNLEFLDDLGPKFKTLADICSPPRSPTPVSRQSVVISDVAEVEHISGPSLETKPPTIHSKSSAQNQNVSISQSSTRVVGFNGAASSSVHGQISNNIVNGLQSPPVSPVTTAMLPSPGPILLLQQQKPVYYTTSPVMQPMHYVVQPQLQSTVLLAGAPVNNLQGMVLLNGQSGHAGSIMHGGNAAGTLTLSKRRGNSVIEENQGVGLQWRSDGSGEVIMDVRRSDGTGQRVEVGGFCNTGMLVNGHISEGTAVHEEVVLTQRGKKQRTRSTASVKTGSMN